MPVEFTVNCKEGYVVAKHIGKITKEVLFTEWQRFYQSDQWTPGLNELTDLSEADVNDLTMEAIREFAASAAQFYKDNEVQPMKSAVFAPRPLPFGLSRMYEAMAAKSPEHVRVFRSKEQAVAWLLAE